MRFIGVLLASVLAIGCGSSSESHDPRLVGSAFSPPSISTLTPNSVPVNSVPFTMTINGNNFLPDAIVFWNGTPLQTTFITSNQLLASLTDTDLTTVGLIAVYVRTGGLNSNTMDFNVTTQ